MKPERAQKALDKHTLGCETCQIEGGENGCEVGQDLYQQTQA